MGKGDKLYITAQEWSNATQEGGMKFGGTTGKVKGSEFKPLPFYSCALSLAPFENPMMAPDGAVFDLLNIVPFLKKYGVHPLTGEKLAAKDLVRLTFHKNAEGDYFCPITFKTFNDHTHIVAIRTSGQVYSYEAVQKLNFAAKNYRDLLTDDPFTKKDVITIQDPHNLEARNRTEFYYVKNSLALDDSGPAPTVNAVGGTTARALKELETRQKEKEAASKVAVKEGPSATVTPSFVSKDTQASNAAHFSNNRMAAGFTSTSFSAPQTKNDRFLIDEEERMFNKIKTKAYAAIRTNFGQINLELHADLAPKTVYNFLMLAKQGYYDNLTFHRNIKDFMIQGGSSDGTGRAGQSFWKKDFEDEFNATLKHDARGILSMANRGKNTNNSQFFITYRATPHLNGKHTVFGKLVGGMEVLDRMEAIPSEEKTDKPNRPIVIEGIDVVLDPFEEYREGLKREEQKKVKEAEREERLNKEIEMNRLAREAREKREAAGLPAEPSADEPAPAVGKYLKTGVQPTPAAQTATTGQKREGQSIWDVDDNTMLANLGGGSAAAPPPKKAKSGAGYGDFSSF